MKMGPIELARPFMQAGIAGYSDRAMRTVARRRGCPYAMTEALLDRTMLSGGLGLKHSIDIDDSDHPVSGQLMGSEGEEVAAAASILAEHGYDVIDLNFACPVKKVKNKARGGWMLQDVPRGIRIMRAVRDALPSQPLTASLRRSFADDGPAAGTHRLLQLIDEAVQLGFAAVRVHGRTVEQKYAGRAEWDVFAAVKAAHPQLWLWGSGDVFTAQDIVRMLQTTPVDGVWVARGAIGNPWIFRDAARLLDGLPGEQLTPPTLAEQRAALQEHFTIACEIHGEQVAGRRMRKQGIKYARFHPQAEQVKAAYINVRSLGDWTHVLDTHYAFDGPGVWPNEDAVDEVNSCEASA